METVVYRPLRPEVAKGTKSEWLLKQRRVDSAPSSAPLLLFSGVAERSLKLLALSSNQRPWRGQAQPRQDPETESLWLPQ